MAKSLRNTPRRTRAKAEKPKDSAVKAVPKPIYILLAIMPLIILALLVVLFMNRGQSLEKTQASIEKVAEVVSHEPVPNSSMHAWFVKLKSDGSPALFYTTKDGKTMAAGTLWDSESGDPISNELTEKLVKNNPELGGGPEVEPEATAAAAPGQADLTPGQAIGDFDGEVPALFNALDGLGGFKEDASVAPEDTIYVLYDPRCPYCHKLFEVTRDIDMKAKGVTMKWLPTVALGSQGPEDPAVAQAALGLEAKSVAEFEASLSGTNSNPDKVANLTEDHFEALDANLALLYDATDRTMPGQPKAVPAVFYLDKRNGAPRLVYGAQEPEVLKSIFGD